MEISDLKIGGTYLITLGVEDSHFIEIEEIYEEEDHIRLYFSREIVVASDYISVRKTRFLCTSWRGPRTTKKSFTPISKERFDLIFNSFEKLSKTLDRLAETKDSPKIF